MTTNNRSSEPTDEQVEAAAIAFTCETHDEWERSPEPYKEMIREDMRAALVAAQCAAPQLIGRLDLARHYWRSQGYDYDLHGQDGNNDYEMGLAVADAALAALAAAQGAAPQAESTADEDALAEAKATALNEAAGQVPFPADPYGGFDHESLRAAYVQITNWLRDRAEWLKDGAK